VASDTKAGTQCLTWVVVRAHVLGRARAAAAASGAQHHLPRQFDGVQSHRRVHEDDRCVPRQRWSRRASAPLPHLTLSLLDVRRTACGVLSAPVSEEHDRRAREADHRVQTQLRGTPPARWPARGRAPLGEPNTTRGDGLGGATTQLDPLRLDKGEDLKKNLDYLTETVDAIANAIFASANDMPPYAGGPASSPHPGVAQRAHTRSSWPTCGRRIGQGAGAYLSQPAPGGAAPLSRGGDGAVHRHQRLPVPAPLCRSDHDAGLVRPVARCVRERRCRQTWPRGPPTLTRIRWNTPCPRAVQSTSTRRRPGP